MRPLSDVERLWLAAERVSPPFALSLVIEGRGEVDLAALRAAAQPPGACLRLQGHLGWSRWTAGPGPRLRRADAWDGAAPGPDWLHAPFDVRNGPTTEIVVLPGRIVFRAHHAVMDGRGLLSWAREVLLSPVSDGLKLQAVTVDRDLAGAVAPEPSVSEDCGAVLGPATLPSLDTQWTTRHVAGRFRGLVPRLVTAVGQATRAHTPEQRCRVDVPVDLRSENTRSTSNLTGIIRVEPEGSAEANAAQISALIAGGKAHSMVLGARWIRWWPLSVLGWLGRRIALRNQARGSYVASATVSSLGKLHPADFSTPHFQAERLGIIPPGQPGLPLLLTATGTEAGVTLYAAAPTSLASEGRLDALLDELVAALTD